MRIDPDRVIPWVCFAAIEARLVAIALKFPPADGDRFWQRWLGERILHEHAIPRSLGAETFAAAGAPWTPHEWLFSLALALGVDRGIPWAVPLACAILTGVALALVIVRSQRRGVSPVLSSAAVLLCGLALMQSYGVRAQVVGWAGVAVVLTLLEREDRWSWLVVPVTLVWANLHASVFLAPAIVLLFGIAAVLQDRRWSRAVSLYASVFACAAAATLATPLGADLLRYAVGLTTSPIRHLIAEWGATSVDSASFTLGALPLLLILAAFGVRASARDRILAIAFSVLLFGAVRNVPVFALATAPIALAALPVSRGREKDRSRVERGVAWSTVGAAAAVAVVVSVLSWRGAPIAAQTLPVGPAQTLLAEARTTPRVFCEDFAWCSLFLADSRPAAFFMDGRCDPYPAAIWTKYLRVLNGNTGWNDVLEAYHVNAVLVRRDSALDSLLSEAPNEWRTIGADTHARLYVRPALIATSPPRSRSDAADAPL